MWSYSPIKTAIILGPLIFCSALALDVYMPVLPEMKNLFHTSQGAIQLSVSIFFLICGLGQLILGPVSDQIGRIKVVWTSIMLCLLGAIGCAVSESIGIFLTFRTIEALGAAGLSMSAFAIVRDVFDGENSAKIYGIINGMLALSPILGPIIGVALITRYPWYSTFYFLACLSILTGLVFKVWGKESLDKANRTGFSWSIFSRYMIIIKSIHFWSFTLPAVAGMSSFFALFSITPYIIESLGLPKVTIVYSFGTVGLSFMLGSFLMGKIVQNIGLFKTTILGVLLIFVSGVALIIFYQLWGLNLYVFFGPCTVATFGCALAVGAGAGGALEPFGQYPGVASAMFGCMQLGGSSVIGTISGLFAVNTSYPLAITMIFTSLIALIVIFLKINSEKILYQTQLL